MKLNLRKTPLQDFSRQLVKIKYIQHIQNDLESLSVHKLHQKIYYLNQSYIFHLVAYWQDFIESLVQRGFDDLKLDKESCTLDSVLERNLKNKLKKFNTPNTKNIDNLFWETFGIEKITSY